MSRQLRETVLPATIILAFLFGFFYYIVYQTEVGMGIDYVGTFEIATRIMLNGDGDELYRVTDVYLGWFNLPWLLYVFVPLQVFSVDAAIVIWNVFAVVLMVAAIELWRHLYAAPTFAVALAMANVHTFDFLLRAQVDTIILFSAIVCWWAIHTKHPWIFAFAFAFMVSKPLNVVFLTLLLLYQLRTWSWRERVIALTPIAVFAFTAFPLFGWDWPIRYIAFGLEEDPPLGLEITLWKGADVLGLPSLLVLIPVGIAVGAWGYGLWRYGPSKWLFGISITTGLFITVFANGNHYILLIPALLLVARYSWQLGIVAYLLTWTPLLRLFYGTDVSPIDILYPTFLMAAMWYLWWQERQPERSMSERREMP